jgi:hypothetical protein
MARFFDFYDPLEKRYVFNSFLVVVGLVELLILVFTLIWQMDEGIFSGQVKVIPFPWKEYLLAVFLAPVALLFLSGHIIQGFERFGRVPEAPAAGGPGGARGAKWGRGRYLLGLAAFIALVVFLVQGRAALALLTYGIKALGLGGSYLLIALMALGLLYLPLRLFLRYRLQKKAMEYQYLLELARRHGVVVVDPKLHPELAAAAAAEKNLPDTEPGQLPAPPGDGAPDPQ